MDNPRAEKVAVVEEVRARLGASSAAVVTEYRGLSVAALAELRRSLGAAGGDYKVFKNTLVRRAVADGEHAPLAELLTGPTAIAFVSGDLSAVAKALRDFSRTNAHLVLKGGLFEGSLLSAADLAVLADLPPREVLLARVAGAIAAPLTQFAGLLQALPRNLAYGLSALLDQRRAGEPPAAPAVVPPPEAPTDEPVATAAEEPGTAEAPTDEPVATAAEEPGTPEAPTDEPVAGGAE